MSIDFILVLIDKTGLVSFDDFVVVQHSLEIDKDVSILRVGLSLAINDLNEQVLLGFLLDGVDELFVPLRVLVGVHLLGALFFSFVIDHHVRVDLAVEAALQVLGLLDLDLDLLAVFSARDLLLLVLLLLLLRRLVTDDLDLVTDRALLLLVLVVQERVIVVF